SALAKKRGTRPAARVNKVTARGSANDRWLLATSTPPRRGRCRPPSIRHRVVTANNGASTSMARPNQNPRPRRGKRRMTTHGRSRRHPAGFGRGRLGLSASAPGPRPGSPVRSSAGIRRTWRSEERRVGKECRGGWSPKREAEYSREKDDG